VSCSLSLCTSGSAACCVTHVSCLVNATTYVSRFMSNVLARFMSRQCHVSCLGTFHVSCLGTFHVSSMPRLMSWHVSCLMSWHVSCLVNATTHVLARFMSCHVSCLMSWHVSCLMSWHVSCLMSWHVSRLVNATTHVLARSKPAICLKNTLTVFIGDHAGHLPKTGILERRNAHLQQIPTSMQARVQKKILINDGTPACSIYPQACKHVCNLILSASHCSKVYCCKDGGQPYRH